MTKNTVIQLLFGKVVMNFGEKLKQLRTERGQTQPQFAEALGIEQSYLSKLENDKSVPSAEMFSTIVAGLGMDAASFLKDLHQEVLETTLRHIPAVAQFTTQAVAQQADHSRRWLVGSALAWILGFALMLAANDGIFFPNRVYHYTSPGVIQAGEAENIFDTFEEILSLRQTANLITREEFAKTMADFKAQRVRPMNVETTENRGQFYFARADGGQRRFSLVRYEHVAATGNRILQFIGAVIFAAGFVGMFTEWRLRRLKNKRKTP
ncbi:helix-turn-helix domain-containing protein [Pseudoduganella sp.]|uniref:helix-turn-helix domain-containing protein n=1 Tax=Pseudoduganella sp. TaxID=1880898 RepID=UPI0035AF1B2C